MKNDTIETTSIQDSTRQTNENITHFRSKITDKVNKIIQKQKQML
jgi:hypothetical protein